MEITILNKGKSWGGDGYDYWAKCEVSEGDQKAIFFYRSIFDYGPVINPGYEVVPGIRNARAQDGAWWHFDDIEMWQKVRDLTEFEQKAVSYLYAQNPLGIVGGLNM